MTTAIVHKPKPIFPPESDPAEGTAAPPIEDSSTDDLDQNIIPKKSATVDECKSALQSIESKFSILDTGLGWIAWLKGKTLIVAKEICLKNNVRFDDFCKDAGLKRSTAYLFIRIANHYKVGKVKGKTLTELRAGITTRSTSTPKDKTTATVRIAKQSIDRIPGDLDTVLKVLSAALNMEWARNQDEPSDPIKVYEGCVQILGHIHERAAECRDEYQGRIDNFRQSEATAADTGKTLESREAA